MKALSQAKQSFTVRHIDLITESLGLVKDSLYPFECYLRHGLYEQVQQAIEKYQPIMSRERLHKSQTLHAKRKVSIDLALAYPTTYDLGVTGIKQAYSY